MTTILSTLIGAVVVVAIAIAPWAGARLLVWRERRSQRRWRKRGLSADHCRVCDRQLPIGEVWEMREHYPPTGDMEPGVGGTFGAIPYCRRHAPKHAVRA